MTRTLQKSLYYLLPIVTWLLAAGGMVLWASLTGHLSLPFFLPAVLVLIVIAIMRHIPRHASTIEPCFRMALLLGVAAYWLPAALLLILPVWGYLFFRHLLDGRSLLASLLGFVAVAIWVVVFYFLSIIPLPSAFFTYNSVAWIPVAIVFVAWLLSVLARHYFYVR